MRPMRKSPTFRDILDEVASPNAERIATRAMLFNRLAKLAQTPMARQRAYAAKTRALEQGIVKFPADYALSSMEEGGRILGIRFRRRCALHVRQRDLSPDVHRWVDAERRRIVHEVRSRAAA